MRRRTPGLRSILASAAILTVSAVRKGVAAWLILAVSTPIALAVALETVVDAVHLYVEEFIVKPSTREALEPGLTGLACRATVSTGSAVYSVMVVAVGGGEACIGVDAARVYGGSLNVSINGVTVRINETCSGSVYSPYIVVPSSILSGEEASHCMVFNASQPAPTLADAEASLVAEASRVLSAIVEALVLAYAPVASVASYNVLSRLEEEYRALRATGVSSASLTLACLTSLFSLSLPAAVTGVSMGVLAAHASLTAMGSLSIYIPYRPLGTQAAVTPYLVTVASLLLGAMVYCARRAGQP